MVHGNTESSRGASRRSPGFTIIELLVVVSIIAMLVAILLPAITKSRDAAHLNRSLSNLRNLGVAHNNYAAEWSGRQATLVVDNLSVYGSSEVPALNAMTTSGARHPDIFSGVGPGGGMWGLWVGSDPATFGWAVNPIIMPSGFGMHRALHMQTCFNQYLSGLYYDPVFYAPKDTLAWDTVRDAFESPWEYTPLSVGVAYSTYCMSAAAMYAPQVFRNEEDGGFQSPWTLKAGFRSPSLSQARYPALKTHMIEHHWLQNRVGPECNPAFAPGTYSGCEPWYFNHSWVSAPMTLFFDGHVDSVGIRAAMRADGRQTVQGGSGLWSRDTGMGPNGYFIDASYDQASTSLHVLTTDGILGRDVLSE